MMALDVLHSSETQFETRNEKNPMSAQQPPKIIGCRVVLV